MKKNLLTATILSLCIFVFAACGSTGGANATSGATPKSSEEAMTEEEKMMEDKAMTEEEKMMEDKAMTEEEKMMEDKAMTEKEKMTEEVMGSDKEAVSMEKKTVENPAPDFTFTDYDGNAVTLADFEDENVYIKFWASWCTVCLSSLPEVDELSAMDKDFKVVTVVAPNFSGEKKMEDFKTWYDKKGYENITVLFDEGGKYMKEFGVRAFPSSAYIDENGGLIKFEIGHNSNENIIKTFEEK